VDAGATGSDVSFGASLASAAAVIGVGYAVWSKLFAIGQAAANFVDDPRSEAAKGSMADVKRQLGKIIRQATGDGRRLVIFVDDLERSRPPRAVDVCETASQLLGHEGVVTILVADMEAIAAAAAIKYADLEGKYVAQASSGSTSEALLETYGRLYLEKIVQIQFDLPPPEREALTAMVLE
jgi:hypothetical protein